VPAPYLFACSLAKVPAPYLFATVVSPRCLPPIYLPAPYLFSYLFAYLLLKVK